MKELGLPMSQPPPASQKDDPPVTDDTDADEQKQSRAA